ncbi:helix-turn-helix transcriptional regulator [Arthrobacter sp. UYEF2]|uniref:helix-turn-helix domain-containing protein n=1 Tax=Pseudarthrobacter sp. S6 TaxID=3418420 RepID=UPI003398AA73
MHGVMMSVADLGRSVYGIRQRSGLSQRELASRLGVSQRYLSELETGKPKVLNDQFFAVMVHPKWREFHWGGIAYGSFGS